MTEDFNKLEGDSSIESPVQSDPNAALNLIQDTMENFIATADVETVYKEPIEHGEALIIPTAEVVAFMGFGVGYGQSSGEDMDSGSGSGGGGGGHVFARPVSVVIASPEGVKVEPVFDMTKIALAGITTAAFMFSMIYRLKKQVKQFD
jgi:uncharacterized spore protein YtfJ